MLLLSICPSERLERRCRLIHFTGTTLEEYEVSDGGHAGCPSKSVGDFSAMVRGFRRPND